MRSVISKTFLLTAVLLVIFVLPFGVFAATNSGISPGGFFSWTISSPASVKSGQPFSITVSARDTENENRFAAIEQTSPISSGLKVCPTAPECSISFSQAVISSAQEYVFRIYHNLESPNFSLTVVPCAGTICFENPLSSLTFWQFFNRIMGFALVAGLATGPIFLLYGVFRFMTSAGDAKKVSDAIRVIKYTLVGLVILLLARGILAVLVQLLLG